MSAIIRDDKETDYVKIGNAVVRDSSLSFAARGVLAYLLSKPKNWKVSVRDIINQSAAGETAVRGWIKELERAGYLERVRAHSAHGKFEWHSVVRESPLDTIYRKTTHGETTCGETPDIRNTNRKNKRFKEVVERESQSKTNFENSLIPSYDEIRQNPLFDLFSRLCGCIYTDLRDKKKAEFAKVIQRLHSGGVTVEHLGIFEQKWRCHWRYINNNGRYPYPHEVLESWREVMDSQY